MFEPFQIALTESLQCAVILTFISIYLQGSWKEKNHLSLVAGVFIALIAGFSSGYFPSISKRLWSSDTWTFWRYIAESVIFYLSIVFVFKRFKLPMFFASAGLAALGFLIFFFELRTVGFLIRDMGEMKGNINGITALGLIGIFSGFIPLLFVKVILRKLPFKNVFTLPSLFMSIGALKFASGGVKGFEEGDIVIKLQKGILIFLEDAVRHMQTILMMQDHPFISIPFTGLGHFISGDRTAMALMILFLMTPPLIVLINLFARPDPIVNDMRISSQKRLTIAFFRSELIYQTIPVLIAFGAIIVLIHAANISMNPLYEPLPATVRESENSDILAIPLSDKLNDFTDKKLRKYVYYYGNKQIVFLAILKPDGSVGVALDECEICRPAEWNKDAQGYAQKGENLICKYCMTPIPLSTINSPGGCNPIPIPFKTEDNRIIISPNSLIDIFKKAKALEKQGTHF